jgi:hypothetical protein
VPHRKKLDVKQKNAHREKLKKKLDGKLKKKLVYVQRQKQKLNGKQRKPRDLKLNVKPLVSVQKRLKDNVRQKMLDASKKRRRLFAVQRKLNAPLKPPLDNVR